jgi:translation initiation factor IF-2
VHFFGCQGRLSAPWIQTDKELQTNHTEVLPMGHKSKTHHEHKTGKHSDTHPTSPVPSEQEHIPTLAVVIKSDTDGCEQAVCATIAKNSIEGLPVEIIHKGVGDICKTDVMAAATGSRLVLGFNVNVLPRVAELCSEQNVEVRLYSVIYKLHEDLREIADSLLPREAEEKILGKAKIIALFKSSRKGIIIGCEVETGRLQRGDHFRIISAMGTVYSGTISSLHIEKDNISKAMPGQQVGLKIENFKNARIGDLVECYQTIASGKIRKWQPTGKILHL